MNEEVADKAGATYWNRTWSESALNTIADPDNPTRGYLPDRVFHGIFHRYLDAEGTDNKRLIEIGCGNSGWLPYFYRRFGIRVTGIDYAEQGCEMSRAIFERDQVPGEVIKGDLFDPPTDHLTTYDYVFSFGVVEHFEDTAASVRAMARFLKPGGVMVTIIPNMNGVIGAAQKYLNRPVYDIHIPLDREDLYQAHSEAGLNVQECRYVVPYHFGVPNLNGLDADARSTKIKTWILRKLRKFQSSLWKRYENRNWFQNPGKGSASYVICIARMPS